MLKRFSIWLFMRTHRAEIQEIRRWHRINISARNSDIRPAWAMGVKDALIELGFWNE